MKVLVIGGGGREHALVWKISRSPLVKKIYCAPGNAGTAVLAETVNIKSGDIPRLLDFARSRAVDLTVVGPEQPLVDGIVDEFEAAGLPIFGPGKAAAALEGSKTFAKKIMDDNHIPTAAYGAFTEYDAAAEFIKSMGAPLVVKADGLAAGKGVVVCQTEDQAQAALKEIMADRVHGRAGEMVVIEECLLGEEASFLAFTDGDTVIPMASSQDHKRVFDDDQGANTGGMGAYSPAPVVSAEIHDRIMSEIMVPAVRGLAAAGIVYRGVLYAGVMITDDGPKTLEFNARFGDPETQPIMVRLESDIVPVMMACLDGSLKGMELSWRDEAAVCVVMASRGYPQSSESGRVIEGLERAVAMPGVQVFHAGTAGRDGRIVTAGGRVLGVTALGETIGQAINQAYQAVALISFDGAHYRRDIGRRALQRGL